MVRKLVWLFAIAFAVPAWAGNTAGVISGKVRNSAGVAQMGAMVEVFAGSLLPAATVFTDSQGSFQALNLPPGTYLVKVSAPSFLPAMREDVGLKAGANLIINITLNTLFEAMQMVPPQRRTAQDQDDWKWILRSSANRPILRVLDDGPLVVVSKSDDGEKAVKARVAFVAGSESAGLGSGGDMTTSFSLERSLFSSGTLAFGGNVGYANGTTPGGVLHASYEHDLPNGSQPRIAVTARRFASPGAIHNAALQALAFTLADNLTLGNILDLELGNEYQTIEYQKRVSALRPFGTADLHLSPNTVLEYRFATAVPNTRGLKGYDTAPADLTESGPRLSLVDNRPVLERARHHEVSLSRRMGKNRLQVAWYRDRLSDPAVGGVGEVSDTSANLLPDFYSQTFTWTGPSYTTGGVRAVVQRDLTNDLSATLDYSYGGALTVEPLGLSFPELRSSIATEHLHSITGKIGGTLPGTHTRWAASYKWTSGGFSLTPVDMFNVSPGQADPYFGVFVRQPIPFTGFMPGHLEALVDVRNLLAQGYVPVVGENGHTVYLVQSARSVRGGLAFTF